MSDANVLWGAEDTASASGHLNHVDFIVKRILNRRAHVRIVQVQRAPYDNSGADIQPGSTVAIGNIDVMPLVNQIDGFGRARKHSTVYKLPYFRYAGGSNAVLLDPSKDDIGLALVADNDGSIVRKIMAAANPGSRRRNNLSDGIFLGFCLGGGSPQQFVSFTSTGINIQDKNGNTISMGPTGVTINGNLFRKSDSHLIFSTSVDATIHVHTDPQGGVVGAPQNP